MKKVLVIAPYAYLPYSSGGQKFIAQFLQHLGKRADLTVISVAENDLSLAPNYKIIPLLKRSFSRYYDTSLVRKISALVKEQGFDTIIWEHPYYAWLAFRVRKRTGIKTFIHTHNIEYQRFRSMGRWWWPLLKWYEQRCFKKADGIFFITPEDKQFAINEWSIPAAKCFDLPFGIELNEYPSDRAESRKEITSLHAIRPDEWILLFTGALGYKPNLDALRVTLDKINPLLAGSGLAYKIIVCGKGLPEEMKGLEAYKEQHVVYAGFVENIDTYYKAADIVLNPVQSGGGIKTKMVEAIAFGAAVVSTETGAAGMDPQITGNKLATVKDDDWPAFVQAILRVIEAGQQSTPPGYYEAYNWDSIINKILTKTGSFS